MSDSVTSAPRLASSSAAAMPLRAAPATVTRSLRTSKVVSFAAHRSFNVASANSAQMIPTITNRAITFGSLHPISSKW